jgi:uncharacterized membrane protein
LLFRCVVAALALAALGVSAYLTVVVLTQSGGPAGCGDGGAFDCQHALSSRWSKWLGVVPVSAPAVGLYATAALAVVLLSPRFPAPLRRIAWSVMLAIALAAAGAALWFVALQVFVVKEVCPYCMTVHGCGLIFAGLVTWRFFFPPRGEAVDLAAMQDSLTPAASDADTSSQAVEHDRRPSSMPTPLPAILAAIAVLGTLIVGQLAIQPKSHAVVDHYVEIQAKFDSSGKTAAPSAAKTTDPDDGSKVDPSPPRPTKFLKLLGGKTFIDLNQHIILGSPDAEIVAVKLFDYTCLHCRIMHRHLEGAREHYGDRLAIVLAPVPLNPSCNHRVKLENPHHVYACFYARLARAVWLEKPERFEEFHAWLMADHDVPKPAATRKFAVEILGADRVGAALLDRKIRLHLGKCVALHAATDSPGQYNGLPQLLLGRSVLRGETASVEDLIKNIEIILKEAREQE